MAETITVRAPGDVHIRISRRKTEPTGEIISSSEARELEKLFEFHISKAVAEHFGERAHWFWLPTGPRWRTLVQEGAYTYVTVRVSPEDEDERRVLILRNPWNQQFYVSEEDA